MTAKPARIYQPILAEITTALFACPDCGAVVWYALRVKHDQLHEQVDALIDTTHAQAGQIDGLHEFVERLEDLVVRARQEADDADTRARRAEDAARDAGYRADDAMRTAERAADAANNAARGW